MAATLFAVARKANPVTEELTCSNTSSLRPFAAIIRKARSLWRSKVAAELAVCAGVSVRSAENWLAGDRSISGDALIRLLSSEHGVTFLDAVVDDMPPVAQARWRREFEKAARRADLRMRQDELQREIDQQVLEERRT